MADRLAERLSSAGIVPIWPVEANEVFVVLPARMDRRLKASGAIYYPWTAHALAWRTRIGGGRDAWSGW